MSARDIADVFPDVIRHAERPILRTAPAPLFLLSRLVRDNGYKVVLTGEGADEVFAGYDIFREARVREFWARNPESAIRAALLNGSTPGWLAPGQAPAFARRFFGLDLDPADPRFARPRWNATAALMACCHRICVPE